MLTTPLGNILIFADGYCIDYEAQKVVFLRSPCDDKPVAGCYRIEVASQGLKAISCTVELLDLKVCNTGDSGENYLNAEFIKGQNILTVGMVSDSPAYESIQTECGLQYILRQPVDKVVFGVAWATDYYGTDDCRTWYAADPTILV